jgi:acyl-CoA thioesterase-1
MSLLRVAGVLMWMLLLASCGFGAKLPRLPPDAKVLAFGDSLTFGIGANPGQSYPDVLQGLIGREVINAGVPGEVSAEGLKRLPRVLDSYRPKVIILCHGLNDLLGKLDTEQTADNIRTMIRLAQSRGIGVVLMAVPRFRLEIAPALFYGTIATEFAVPYDPGVVSRILNDDALKSDRIHPNGQGYRVMAEAVAARLREAGAI